MTRIAHDDARTKPATDTASVLIVRSRVPGVHGQTQLKLGPRKNEPMIVSVAPNMNSIVNSVMASFRSPGLVLGFRST